MHKGVFEILLACEINVAALTHAKNFTIGVVGLFLLHETICITTNK